MQMTAKPAAPATQVHSNFSHLSFLSTHSICFLLAVTNGKVFGEGNSRYWPRIGVHLHFIARIKEKLPPHPLTFLLYSFLIRFDRCSPFHSLSGDSSYFTKHLNVKCRSLIASLKRLNHGRVKNDLWVLLF